MAQAVKRLGGEEATDGLSMPNGAIFVSLGGAVTSTAFCRPGGVSFRAEALLEVVGVRADDMKALGRSEVGGADPEGPRESVTMATFICSPSFAPSPA